MAKPKRKRTVKTKRGSKMNLNDEIAVEAYLLYEKSGRVEGRDLENWFEAERIVMERHKEDEHAVEDMKKTKTQTSVAQVEPETAAREENKKKR